MAASRQLDRTATSSVTSKAEALADAFRRDIATGRYRMGELIPPESELLIRYDISRPSYREAIRMLESEGLVEVKRGVGGGTRVLTPSLAPLTKLVGVFLQRKAITVESLFHARILYEPEIAAEIAKRRDEQAMARLAEQAAAQEFCVKDRSGFHSRERAFRAVLIEHTENPVIGLIAAMIDGVFNHHLDNLSQGLPVLSFEEEHLRDGVRAKQQLVRAMADGDHHRARRLWRAYVTIYLRRLTAVIGRNRVITAYRDNESES